ncbi:DUF4139 domain-containing protein [Jannaschia rubra]|uniref:DUF4139 domain-containing protein n=1 Tax=Jannaschia rubra TaxID=282197 RepID=UPI0024919F84|nr:DUF4139 domain-containing protein [Jannaschia rubra]
MRCAIFLCLLPGMALAEDFTLTAPATGAVIYPQGATVTRAASVQVPQGTHRLMVPMTNGRMPRIAVEGAALGATQVMTRGVIDGRRLFTPAQAAAHEALLDAREAQDRAEDARIAASAALEAAEARMAFLKSVSGAQLAGLDAEAVIATAGSVAEGVVQAQGALAEARAATRDAVREVEEAARVVAQAERDFEATAAQLGPVDMLAVTVTAATAGEVALTLEDQVPDAGWSVAYDAMLEGEALSLRRNIRMYQSSGLALEDIDLTLSTASPAGQSGPSEVYPDQATIVPPPDPKERDAPAGALLRSAPEMAVAADTALAPTVLAQANLDGPVVTYSWPEPISLPAGGAEVTLTLDTLDLDARVFNRAVPRRDETAFLVAEVTNDTGEPLLSGPMQTFRDGALVGETMLPQVPAGDEAELSFGPQEHLRLEYRRLDNTTGDRGIFVTSGTRQQDLVFRVRNLSDAPEMVETIFALPFSEQQDLEITLDAAPEPDRRDLDEKRGVAQWTLDVAAGEEAEVRLDIRMEWPERQQLQWYP